MKLAIAGLVPLMGGAILIATAPSPAASQATATRAPAAFQQCATCHAIEAGKNGIGPSLAGVYGRRSGTARGYSYSPGMQRAGKTWSEQELDVFLSDPGKAVPGTRMPVPVRNAAQRKAIIEYLKTL